MTIGGVVTYPDGSPASGITVRLETSSDADPATSITDADGHYQFEASPGTDYSLYAVPPTTPVGGTLLQAAWYQKPSLGLQTAFFTLTEQLASTPLNLAFEPAGRLYGIVRLNGKPRAGVKVCLGDSDSCRASDTQGRYEFLQLPTDAAFPAPIAFASKGDPFDTTYPNGKFWPPRLEMNAYIEDDHRDLKDDINLAPPSYVSGVVLRAGKPVAKATVCVTSDDLQKACTTSDARGKYRLRLPAPGFYDAYFWLEATQAGVASQGVRFLDNEAQFTLTLPKLKKLKSAVPTISGSRHVGSTLTVNTGSWTKGTSFTYSWYRDGKTISGVVAKTYKLVDKDRGSRITVRVTGKRTGYQTVHRTSAKTARIAKAH